VSCLMSNGSGRMVALGAGGNIVISNGIWIPLGRRLGVAGGNVLVGGFATSGGSLY